MKKTALRPMITLCVLILAFETHLFAESTRDVAKDSLSSIPNLRIELGGFIGRCVDAVVNNWSLRVPRANPALISVFELRDRKPDSDSYYVPWAGEFVGKHLLASTLLAQLYSSPEQAQSLDALTQALVAVQDDDGYLGPFPFDKRLRVGWDLWGHYHAIIGLEERFQRTGDERALTVARRAADCICAKFQNDALHPKDVGSDEMNLAALAALLRLYRLGGEERYFQTALLFLKDLESCGDFYRLGLEGCDFFKTPRPRWESLHTIMGLAEMRRLTGDDSYLVAFNNLYSSIRTREIHNNGSFSCGEQAIGTPYKDGPIETCCTVAWTALSVEALRLSGDSTCADELEKSLYNGIAAYTHPSGSWCAYNTPMNGRREASFHTINFQSRPGQPELNCCSVNGPRGFGEIVNWGIMQGVNANGKSALFVNYYGSMRATFEFDGSPFELVQKTNYPFSDEIELTLKPLDPVYEKPISLLLRVPQWARGAEVFVNNSGQNQSTSPGGYFEIERTWREGDSVRIRFPLQLRYESGDDDFYGRASFYYGPILLAYDQLLNSFEDRDVPTITPNMLSQATFAFPERNASEECVGRYRPNILVTIPVENEDGTVDAITLCDFATAGARGETYASWLPTRDVCPSPPICEAPRRNATLASGAILFSRRRSKDALKTNATVVVFEPEEPNNVIFEVEMGSDTEAVASPELVQRLRPNKPYFWKIVAKNEFGTVESRETDRSFSIDPNLPPEDCQKLTQEIGRKRTWQNLVVDSLAGKSNPEVGTLHKAENVAFSDANGVNAAIFNGVDSEIIYQLEEFPAYAFEASLDFMLAAAPPTGQISEIMSAWARGMDDPVRLAVDDQERLYGAVEGTLSGQTRRIKLTTNEWYHARIIKEGASWRLYLNDELVDELTTEEVSSTTSSLIGLGCNPKFRAQSEFFNGKIANFKLSGVIAR